MGNCSSLDAEGKPSTKSSSSSSSSSHVKRAGFSGSDPTLEHDIYISYCPDNCLGGSAFTSRYQDPNHIAAALSRTFKPWVASVCLGPKPSGDFYEDRALHLQKVKVFVALISPEYSQNDQCKMEYQFALLSLKKPVLPVIIAPGDISSTIQAYIDQDGRIPFKMESPVGSEGEFQERMEYLADAIKKMINTVNTERETSRLQHLTIDGAGEGPPSYEQAVEQEQARLGQNIRDRVPQVGDHVIAHWQQHSYFTATIVRFIKSTMKFEIRWDDQDESGRFPDLTMVALNKVPDWREVTVGSRVFFPQGSYCGQEGVRTGGMRYHEGVVTRTEPCSGNRLRCFGHHLKGGSDGKWVTYKDYNYNFTCFSDDLRVAANPYNVTHAYSNM
ncbi:hypothetical protein ACHWQZ_G005919 [Mnemiopsis leidyi]